MARVTKNIPILEFDEDGNEFPSPLAFEGFVNPNQKQSVTYGPKTRGQGFKKVAKPGDPIKLTRLEFTKMQKKGLASKLLVKTLPEVVGGKAAEDDPEVAEAEAALREEGMAELEAAEAEIVREHEARVALEAENAALKERLEALEAAAEDEDEGVDMSNTKEEIIEALVAAGVEYEESFTKAELLELFPDNEE